MYLPTHTHTYSHQPFTHTHTHIPYPQLGRVWDGDVLTSVAEDTCLEKEPHTMFHQYIHYRAKAQVRGG